MTVGEPINLTFNRTRLLALLDGMPRPRHVFDSDTTESGEYAPNKTNTHLEAIFNDV